MKARITNLGDIVRQLQAGIDIVQNSSRFKVFQPSHRLYALLLYDKHVHSADFARKPVTVKFRKRALNVIRQRCGFRLDALP
jgi:hypothetical protein